MSRHRGGADRDFGLYRGNTTLGWSVIGRVSFAKGESKVTAGVWRHVNDEMGNHIGYQMIASSEARVDADLRSRPMPVSITAAQMEANACVSKTAGLNEDARMERVAAGREAEDEVERVQMKVKVFRRLCAAKGDILRVWPLDAAEPLTAGI